jgi:hypothetical protein
MELVDDLNSNFMNKIPLGNKIGKKLSTVNLTKDFKPTLQAYTTETVFRPTLLTPKDAMNPMATTSTNTFMSPRFSKNASPVKPLNKAQNLRVSSNTTNNGTLRYLNPAKEALKEGLKQAE